MAKKYYAVMEGYDAANKTMVKNRIVETWDECFKYVNGVKGAKYKSFTTIEDAKFYLGVGESSLKKDSAKLPVDQHHCYVDGSFNEATGKYSYALVIVKDDVIVYLENGSAENNKQKDIRQIGGELRAAVRAAEYCRDNSITEFLILHDYAGVCYHATGFWDRKEESSKKYYEAMNSMMRNDNLKITFVKVDSHTGDLYNEIADELAKTAGDIPVKGETRKYLKSKCILVSNSVIKNKLVEIVGENYTENIKII